MNKYIWGSLLLIAISIFGLWWIGTKKAETNRQDSINAIYPTVTGAKNVTPKKAVPTKMVVGKPGNKGGLTDDGETQTIFESVYSPDRKLYIEKEFSGTRYVLYRSDSKITVHVGNIWSWVHPRRELTSTGVVPGYKTFTYEIPSQKIVDFESGNKKYTIQCVHNGVEEFKTECNKFLTNFKLL